MVIVDIEDVVSYRKTMADRRTSSVNNYNGFLLEVRSRCEIRRGRSAHDALPKGKSCIKRNQLFMAKLSFWVIWFINQGALYNRVMSVVCRRRWRRF